MIFSGGCSRGNQNTDKTKTSESSVITGEEAGKNNGEQRVLAMAGTPNENGYYTIDLPRSAADLSAIERINDRLCWISVVMTQENTDSFEAVPDNLMWKTLSMEISFNYGSTLPFKEDSSGDFTRISVKDLEDFAKQCFNINKDIDMKTADESFSMENGLVKIKYKELEENAFGFVMSEYKQVEDRWYVKGEIMSSGDEVFAKGEFVLEENKGDALVSHRIVSFTKE